MSTDFDSEIMFTPLDLTKESRRHTKGPKRRCLGELPPSNRKSVVKCRQYRKMKNSTMLTRMKELHVLEVRNMELRKQEKELREKMVRFKTTYLKLISDEKIKLCT